MRILFLTDNFPPETNAPATRTFEHCQAWVESGAQVTVITCAPNFPQGKVYKGYRNRLYQVEIVKGIRVIRVWSYITKNEGFTRRIVDYISFAFMSFLVGLFQKHDIIIATSPQFFTTWSAVALSKLHRKPWVFELRDLWPESIRTVGAIKKSKVLDWLEAVELWLYRDSTRVIAVTDAFKGNLIDRGIDASKIDVVTNGANLELYQPCKKNEKLLNQLGLKGKFIIGYIGTHGMAHNLDFIVRAIAKVQDPNIHFLFIGDGAMKKTVVGLAKSLKLKNTTFLEPISKDLVPAYISIIDVSLAPLIKSETFKTVIPSKIFEASAMQKPTLLGVEGQAQKIVEDYNAGVCYKPEDEVDFLYKLHKITNQDSYIDLQKGCDKLAHDFDRSQLASKMLKILINITK
jgi:glycosyltransferase involved in cell wall biosynthesis